MMKPLLCDDISGLLLGFSYGATLKLCYFNARLPTSPGLMEVDRTTGAELDKFRQAALSVPQARRVLYTYLYLHVYT